MFDPNLKVPFWTNPIFSYPNHISPIKPKGSIPNKDNSKDGDKRKN